MALIISTTVEGFITTKESLAAFRARVKVPRPALKLIGEEFLASTDKRFHQGVDVDGQPLTPSRRVKEGGGQTLWNKGKLFASINYDPVGNDTLDIFSSDKRAAVLAGLRNPIKPKNGEFLTIAFSKGGEMHFRKVREVNMPRRDYLGFSRGDSDAAAELLGDWLVEPFEGGPSL